VYNDEKIDYNNYDVTNLDNKFVKVVVVNKSDTFLFDRFIDRIQNQNIHELKIAENFNEFIGENVDDEGLAVDDTGQLVDDYIDGVDTDLDKDRIKVNMRELMTEAQALEIA
jgi:NADH dehydrogenase FAD-containing subunit